jgi:hypothetical protein
MAIHVPQGCFVSRFPLRTTSRMVPRAIAFLALFSSSLFAVHAQQTEASRYDVFAGFTSLNAPALGLSQPGFHTQAGINMRPWYSLGFDYSLGTGSEILKPDLRPADLQAAVAGAEQQYIAAGLLPAGYQVAIKTDVFTQTFAAGPQLAYRHYTKATFFLRPSLGALREHATPHPSDPFATIISEQLAPAGSKTDWTGFYGLGGGVDYSITKHFGVRAQMDAVYNHPFNDILANGRWTYRYSVGPSFHFGHNILAKPVAAHAMSTTPERLSSNSVFSSLGSR